MSTGQTTAPAEHLARIEDADREKLADFVLGLAAIIFPEGDADHACGADEIGNVANLMIQYGFAPSEMS